MYCPKCGRQNPDGAAFCSGCGTQLQRSTAGVSGAYQNQMAQGYVQAPQYQNCAPQMRPVAPFSTAVREIKRKGSSPLFLACAIIYSAAVLLDLISKLTGTSGLMGVLTQLGYMMGMSGSVLSALSTATAGSAIGTIIGMIPTFVIVAGLWLIFAAAMDRYSGTMKTAGLTMIKVICILAIIGMSIVLAIGEIALIVTTAAIPSYMDDLVPLFIWMIVLVLVSGGLNIFYQAKIVSSINSIKSTIATGKVSKKISLFVAIVNFISGGLSLLGLIFGGTISNAISHVMYELYGMSLWLNFRGVGFIGVLDQLFMAAAMIAFGALIIDYRRSMVPIQYGKQISAQSVQQASAGVAAQPARGVWSVAQVVRPVETAGVAADTAMSDLAWGQTTVLSENAGSSEMPWLEKVQSGEKIYVTTNPFRIGKDPGSTEYCIHNPAVSRVHAQIVRRADGYYIMDNSSTNHVYINGSMIPARTEIKLVDQMKLRLADEDFIYHSK